MNYKEKHKKINEERKKINKPPISYHSVWVNMSVLGKTQQEIIEKDFTRGGLRGTGPRGKFKLSERDFKRAKYLFNNGYNIPDLVKEFGVSETYFDYHSDKLKN